MEMTSGVDVRTKLQNRRFNYVGVLEWLECKLYYDFTYKANLAINFWGNYKLVSYNNKLMGKQKENC